MMDWLAKVDIVHVIVDAVWLMDLSDVEATCKVGRAGPAAFRGSDAAGVFDLRLQPQRSVEPGDKTG